MDNKSPIPPLGVKVMCHWEHIVNIKNPKNPKPLIPIAPPPKCEIL